MEQAFFAPFQQANRDKKTPPGFRTVSELAGGYDSEQRMFMAMEKSQKVTSAS